ncbi:MAG: hypothetical protein F6K14_04580 [Symploca sp. SIO2C1]|nr:hypothetical protein [Symploca sp. SIO2C1]
MNKADIEFFKSSPNREYQKLMLFARLEQQGEELRVEMPTVNDAEVLIKDYRVTLMQKMLGLGWARLIHICCLDQTVYRIPIHCLLTLIIEDCP